MIGFCSLGSGSKGNSLLVSTPNVRFLVDAGLSGRATVERLAQLGVAIETIDAIIVTHEHHDHIAGLKQLAIKRKIPVYANAETAKGICVALNQAPSLRIFKSGSSFSIADVTIESFPILHDTLDPVGFTISFAEHKLGICTDLGVVTPSVIAALKGCSHLVVEANHEPERVVMSARPYIYKQRVLGSYGHLSNQACCNLLKAILDTQLRTVHLAHLSGECNCPDLALKSMQPIQELAHGDIAIHITHQDRIGTPVHLC